MIKKLIHRRGSIMIWTLLLGIVLTTVFFFFSQRLNLSAAQQQKTIEYQNSKIFLDSYVDYLETLTLGDLEDIREIGDIDFEGITGTVTNVVEEITAVLDEGDTIEYAITLPEEPQPADKVTVSWNSCADGEEGRVFTITPDFGASVITPCGTGYEGVGETTDLSFELSAPMAPVSYKILPLGEAVIYDNYWTVDLEMIIGFRKKVEVKRVFLP